MKNEKFGWAIIGSGNIAKICGLQLRISKNHRVVSIYSRNQKTAESLARITGGDIYDTLQKAVTADGVDGVYIATPHSVHAVQAIRCLELKKPVLIEKAICVNTEELLELLRVADECRVYVSEAMWTRYNHVTRKVVEWIEAGRIGKITGITATFSFDANTKFTPPRVRENRYAGGALLDVGVYPIAYCQMLLGKAAVIECESFINESDVDAHDEITLTYQSGALCKLYCGIDGKRPKEAIIQGESGKIVVGSFSNAIKATLVTNTEREVYRKICTYMPEFDKVASDIKEGKLQSDEMTHRDSIEVLQMIDECRRQIGLIYDNDKR
ncbi:MAG: Gfo/Idh/MocA family oxidoreductase [Clostridia bacterium]